MSSSSTETTVDVVMPQMGVSVSEGTIVEWRKQVGDWVEYEEAIVDISTDKIDTEVPSPAAGVISEILVQEGETVEVGTVLARIGGEGTSVSTLSVEISSSVSSASIVSPTCFDHFVIVPSDTETPIWGMTTSTAVVLDIST